jgi:hypothetical protein
MPLSVRTSEVIVSPSSTCAVLLSRDVGAHRTVRNITRRLPSLPARTHTHVRTRTHAHACKHARAHTHASTRRHACAQTHLHAHTHAHTRTALRLRSLYGSQRMCHTSWLISTMCSARIARTRTHARAHARTMPRARTRARSHSHVQHRGGTGTAAVSLPMGSNGKAQR